MISPPMMESFPVSASPRRMANPPPTTQIVPKMNPMSITMPNADEAPDESLSQQHSDLCLRFVRGS